ncbi:hypothetical protein Misp06_00792 [Microbulbifer sp. NBRC 101763]
MEISKFPLNKRATAIVAELRRRKKGAASAKEIAAPDALHVEGVFIYPFAA